jgi:hypothetical protein
MPALSAKASATAQAIDRKAGESASGESGWRLESDHTSVLV